MFERKSKQSRISNGLNEQLFSTTAAKFLHKGVFPIIMRKTPVSSSVDTKRLRALAGSSPKPNKNAEPKLSPQKKLILELALASCYFRLFLQCVRLFAVLNMLQKPSLICKQSMCLTNQYHFNKFSSILKFLMNLNGQRFST